MDRNKEKVEKARKAKKRKALSRLRKTLSKAKDLPQDGAFSDWENEFATSLEQRLETFDSAFADPEKGKADEALSYRQAYKLKEIEDKAAGKQKKPWNRGGGFKRKTPIRKSYRDTQIEEEVEEFEPPRPTGPPKLSVIKGGKGK